MAFRSFVVSTLVLVVLGGAVACSDDASPPVDPVAAEADAAPGDGAPGEDAARDAGGASDGAAAPGDAAADARDAGGACHARASVGALVAPEIRAGSPPAPTGGTLVDGTYVLTSVAFYGRGAAPADGGLADEERGLTAYLAGDVLETVERRGVRPEQRVALRLVRAGTTLTLSETCPEVKAGTTLGYTATATSLELLNEEDGILFHLTRR